MNTMKLAIFALMVGAMLVYPTVNATAQGAPAAAWLRATTSLALATAGIIGLGMWLGFLPEVLGKRRRGYR